MEIQTREWHSINLLPSFAATSVARNTEPLMTMGRAYEFSWLGYVIRITVSANSFRPAWTLGPIGPAWSYRRRCWYWIPRN
jgi:hypothetical protein